MMEMTSLRQFLRSLCEDLQWDYAVFWKLRHRSRIYVGGAASTGKHHLIFADEFDSKLLPEFPDEFHLQFAVGIQTILLIPVTPHGVVQLGSLQKVNEDPALVAHIKDTFSIFQHNLGAFMPSNSNGDLPGPSSSLLSSLLEKLTSANSCNVLNAVQSKVEENKLLALDRIRLPMNSLTNSTPDMKFQFITHDNLQAQGDNTDNIRDANFGDQFLGSAASSLLQNHLSSANHLQMMEPGAPNISCQEDLQFISQCDSTEIIFSAHTDVGLNFYPFDDMMDQQCQEETGEVTDWINSLEFMNFPADSELHKALAPAIEERSDEYLLNSNVLYEDVYGRSVYHKNYFGGVDPSVGDSHRLCVKGSDADNLLDAIVPSMCEASVDISSTRSTSSRSPTISSRRIATSCQTQSQHRSIGLEDNNSGQWSSIRTGFVPQHGDVLTRSSLKRPRSNVINEEQHKVYGRTQSRNSTKGSHIGEKKARHSNVQKPRPRDRQMIQDRVKELRELIPNGAKCSIDALLDQTIKHMLFLRSVTKRAEKLNQSISPEAFDTRNWNSSENQSLQNGASWAYDLDSQVGVCPIVVKDLEQPGHMLIEMLCEENGLFLEIAQVIRHLDLTILKGLMEDRSGKSWAHFIVEVSTGFRRMDIFWPLMKLLQRNSSISSMI
ncbi:Transcription factor lhw [Thalictrum thalictroides]|uniref:Transcription factor lhw n=1 Tax=Thalictrum thalictroides TaxID=46969 RepID=A0A7J6WW02_THATH|nr:Transcription factor lhw [Thalictrum thalictroides]